MGRSTCWLVRTRPLRGAYRRQAAGRKHDTVVMSCGAYGTTPLLRQEARSLVVPFACSGVLLAFDFYLYRSGVSWTPMHYESLAPLLAVGCNDSRASWISSLAGVLLFGATAMLFFP